MCDCCGEFESGIKEYDAESVALCKDCREHCDLGDLCVRFG